MSPKRTSPLSLLPGAVVSLVLGLGAGPITAQSLTSLAKGNNVNFATAPVRYRLVQE